MKRIFSFLLAALLLVSAVPTALATNDYSQGTQVVYQSTGSESYTITVPAQLTPGGSGTVTLSGTWADNRIVTVTADPTVTLKNSIKETDTKTLNVNFDGGISENGSNTTSQTFTKDISVDGITDALFGTWSGKFNYNVEIGNAAIAAYSYNGHILPQIPQSTEHPYAYIFTMTGETLNKDMTKFGLSEYIGVVDKIYNIQLSTHPYTYEDESRFSNQEFGGEVLAYICFEGSFYLMETGSNDFEGASYGIPGNADCQFVWCNTDLVNPDGSIYLAASAPVPVYE